MFAESGTTTATTLATTPAPGSTTGTSQAGPATTTPAPQAAGECPEAMSDPTTIPSKLITTSGPASTVSARDGQGNDGVQWTAPVPSNKGDPASKLTINLPKPSVVEKLLLTDDFTKAIVTLYRVDGTYVDIPVFSGKAVNVRDYVPDEDDDLTFTKMTVTPVSSPDGSNASFVIKAWACVKAVGE